MTRGLFDMLAHEDRVTDLKSVRLEECPYIQGRASLERCWENKDTPSTIKLILWCWERERERERENERERERENEKERERENERERGRVKERERECYWDWQKRKGYCTLYCAWTYRTNTKYQLYESNNKIENKEREGEREEREREREREWER